MLRHLINPLLMNQCPGNKVFIINISKCLY